MALPVIRKKEKAHTPQKPQKKKYALDRDIVEGIDRCKAKSCVIKKAIKGTDEELEIDIDADIEKAVRSIVKKYEKSLDQIIDDRSLMVGEKNHTDSTTNRTANLFPTETVTSNPIFNHLHSEH